MNIINNSKRKIKMITSEEIEKRVRSHIPNAIVTAENIEGKSDYIYLQVTSEQFSGMSLVKQHRAVNSALQEELDSGKIHALKISTAIP